MLNIEKINRIIDSKFKKDYTTARIYSTIHNFYASNSILDPETISIALIYLDRYNKKSKIDSKNLNDIVFACLLLSSKFSSDLEITCTCKRELDVIEKLDWSFFVSKEEFEMYNKFIQLLL